MTESVIVFDLLDNPWITSTVDQISKYVIPRVYTKLRSRKKIVSRPIIRQTMSMQFKHEYNLDDVSGQIERAVGKYRTTDGVVSYEGSQFTFRYDFRYGLSEIEEYSEEIDFQPHDEVEQAPTIRGVTVSLYPKISNANLQDGLSFLRHLNSLMLDAYYMKSNQLFLHIEVPDEGEADKLFKKLDPNAILKRLPSSRQRIKLVNNELVTDMVGGCM